MKNSDLIKILISSVLGIIIDQTFSITDIIREAIEPFLFGPYLVLKPLILLCFFLAEIGGIYELISKFRWLEKFLEDSE
jgi:hypothetical protein